MAKSKEAKVETVEDEETVDSWVRDSSPNGWKKDEGQTANVEVLSRSSTKQATCESPKWLGMATGHRDEDKDFPWLLLPQLLNEEESDRANRCMETHRS